MRKLYVALVLFLFFVTACGSNRDDGTLTPEQLAQLQAQQQQQQQYYYPPTSEQYYDQYSQEQYYQQTTSYCTGTLAVYGQDGVLLGELTNRYTAGSICANYNSTIGNQGSKYGAYYSDESANNPNAQFPPVVYCWDGATLQLSGYLSANPQYANYSVQQVAQLCSY